MNNNNKDQWIKYIDIHAKEWYDKVYGNSYFSAIITINDRLEDEKTVKLPFQYGYGDHYLYVAMNELVKQDIIHPENDRMSLWQYAPANNIKLYYHKDEKCLQREVKNWGGK